MKKAPHLTGALINQLNLQFTCIALFHAGAALAYQIYPDYTILAFK